MTSALPPANIAPRRDSPDLRHDPDRPRNRSPRLDAAEVTSLLGLPLMDLLFHAQRVHREHHEPNTVQMSTLLSIKTGACPEDCAYCPQSVRYDTGLEREELMEVAAVRERAQRAARAGATRFCMGAAYRSPKAKELRRHCADGPRGQRARDSRPAPRSACSRRSRRRS